MAVYLTICERNGATMAIKDALLPEFDQEMASTRKVIERVPAEKFGYKPHDRSMTMGVLASHIADMPTWAFVGISQDSLDLAGGFKAVSSRLKRRIAGCVRQECGFGPRRDRRCQ